MICPRCQSEACRRSRRRGVGDLFFTLFGLRPWRCRTCEARFYAWKVPVSYVRYAHCPKCGNFDLQRISRERVDEGSFLALQRILGFSAYRCDPCRTRFFSVLTFHRIVPVPPERVTSQSTGQ
jgi:hypothetical protein